jgi:hypothetical protein
MIARLTAAVCVLVAVGQGSVADAQIVRVGGLGGVRVRAPFVAVDVLPFGGGTRVRAPFTSVRTGYYRYGYPGIGYGYGYGYAVRPYPYLVPPPVYVPVPVVPVVPVPVVPVPAPPVVYPEPESYSAYAVPSAPPTASYDPLSADTLAERLRAAAVQLANSLSRRRDDADVWLDYLGPEAIVDAIDRGGDEAELRDLAVNYDAVVSTPQLHAIRASAGFRETRRLLKPWIDSMPRRDANRELDRSGDERAYRNEQDFDPFSDRAAGGDTDSDRDANGPQPDDADGAAEELPVPPLPEPPPPQPNAQRAPQADTETPLRTAEGSDLEPVPL